MCKGRRYILRRAGIGVRRRPTPAVAGERRRGGQSLDAEITMLAAALNELTAIRNTAEQAAGNIIASAERLLQSSESNPGDRSEEAALSIMTACGFNDLVGQRAAKISETIDKIIAARLQRAERARKQSGALRAKRKAALMLNGPAFPGGCPDQAHIDSIFAEA
jgi:chemotaxis regulatin CheY-phosphate phosphatase CheZ